MKTYLFLIFLMVSPWLYASDSTVADSMYSETQSQTGSASAISSNLMQPLSSDDQSLTTFDGKTNVNFRLSCEGSNPLFKIMVQPSNTGLEVLNIYQDSDLDGTIDSYSAPDWQVSAVCANGFMTCTDPTDGSTCDSYEWAVGSDNVTITRKQVAVTDLGGCYCISNQCGSNLVWSNLTTILQEMGTGAANALLSANPLYEYSSVDVSDTIVTVNGSQGATACDTTDADSVLGSSDTSQLTDEDYWDDTESLDNAGSSASDSNTYYSLIQDSVGEDPAEYESCTITRNLSLYEQTWKDVIALDSGAGTLTATQTADDETTLQFSLGQEGDDYLKGNCAYFRYDAQYYVKIPADIISADITYAVFDDWLQLYADDTLVWNGPKGTWTGTGGVPGDCELGSTRAYDLDIDLLPYMQNVGQVDFGMRLAVGGEGDVYMKGTIVVKDRCEVQDNITNTCTAIIDSDQNCTLYSESVDGVSTVTSGGVSTGLSPYATTTTLTGQTCTQTVSRDWMKKSRVYRCDTDADTDFTEVYKRVGYAKDNSTSDEWADRSYDADTGTYSYSTGDWNLPDQQTGSCVNYCKTRSETTNTNMLVSGDSSSNRTTTTSYDVNYRQCTNDGATCPTEDGETVLEDCQCLDEFANAASIMQTIRSAAQDLICSDGTEVEPDE